MTDPRLLLERIKLPTLFWDCKLANIPDDCQHKERLVNYTKNFLDNCSKGRGLLLWGDYLRGKSALAAIILKCAVVHKKTALWAVCADIPKYIVEKPMFDSEVTYYERCLNVDVLALDELIIQGDGRASEVMIEMLVRERIRRVKTTIITTNHSPDYLMKKFPAFSAVLRESVLPVEVKGHDFRKNIGQKILSDLS